MKRQTTLHCEVGPSALDEPFVEKIDDALAFEDDARQRPFRRGSFPSKDTQLVLDKASMIFEDATELTGFIVWPIHDEGG